MSRAAKVRVAAGMAVAALALLAVVLLGSRPDPIESRGPLPSASPQPTQPSPPIAAPSPSAPPTASPTVGPEIAAVWLIDTAVDRSLRLTETTGFLLHAGFDGAGSEVLVGTSHLGPPQVSELQRFDLKGNVIRLEPWPERGIGPHTRCVEIRSVYQDPPGSTDPLVEIDGRPFEGVSCGPFSPDGRWMTYWIWAEGASAEAVTNKIDQWAIEIDTGERRLLYEGLVHCGGCDSVPGAKWSPSGQFVYFSDVVAGGDRFFVSDVVAARTRQLTEHEPREPYDVPDWSPVADVLLSTNSARVTVMEDLRTGNRTVLHDLAWPARFDPTGAFLYSPAWVNEGRAVTVTTVRHVVSGRIFPPMPGTTGYRSYIGLGGPPIPIHPVVGLGDGFVAALQNVPGCLGTAIYRDGVLSECVARGTRPVFSPDGTKLALACATGDPVTQSMCSGCFVAEIVVIDVLSGREIVPSSRSVRVVISETPFPGGGSADYSWNTAGTHLLIAGPAAG